jgi:riboflavin biosynthesis pyrimidine reductase
LPQRGTRTLASLQTLFETKRGTVLPLTPSLARLYGCLRMPRPRARPHVISNFVTTLDGIVSLQAKGHSGGGDISGFNAQDRMVMGLLRAIADVVIVGSGALAADRRHVWTAETIFPPLSAAYRQLSDAMGKRGTPLNVVVSGSGRIDLRLPVFASGAVSTLIVTTAPGAKRLRKQSVPDSVKIRAIRGSGSALPGAAIVDAVCRVSAGKLILVEGGPRLLGDFYAQRLIDEQFFTVAPQIAGREVSDGRLSLVMGKTFAPRDARWGP